MTDLPASRTEWWRFDVLDQGLRTIGELQPEYGAAAVDNNINRDIKRQLGGLRIDSDQLADFDVLRHRVAPVLVIDGVEYPQGVFLVADHTYAARSSSAASGLTADGELSLVDQGLMLSHQLDRNVSYGPGTDVAQAIAQLAAEAGVRAIRVDETAVGQVLAGPANWAVGKDTRLKAMNELAAMGGFHSPYFDNLGVMVLRRAADLSTGPVDIDFDHPPRIFAGTVVTTNDVLTAPNRYVALATNATEMPVWGSWDVPDEAPHSYRNRGFYITKVYEQQGLSAANAHLVARTLGQQDASTFEWVDFQSVADPAHDTFQVVQYRGVRWREQSWALELRAGGAHRHQLRRVYTDDD